MQESSLRRWGCGYASVGILERCLYLIRRLSAGDGAGGEYLPYFLFFGDVGDVFFKGDRLERIESEEVTGWTALSGSGGVVFIFGGLANFSLEEPSMQFCFCSYGTDDGEGNEEESGCGLQGTGCGRRGSIWRCGLFKVWAGYVYFMMIPGISAEGTAVRGEKE